MIRATAIVLLFCALAAVASERTTVPGDYVVVYAHIKGCPDFPGIIAFHQVATDSTLILPGLNPVGTQHLTRSQIQESLAHEIAGRRSDGNIPGSLHIEVLESEQEYLILEERILSSFKYLSSNNCIRPAKESAPSRIEDQRQLKRLEWHRIAASPLSSGR